MGDFTRGPENMLSGDPFGKLETQEQAYEMNQASAGQMQQLINLANKQWSVREPVYEELGRQGVETLQKPWNPTLQDVGNDPMFQVGKMGLEGSYQQARENVMGNLPKGGPMQSTLTQLEGNRADSQTGLISQILQSERQYRERERQRLYGLATGNQVTPGTGEQGYAGSAAQQMQAASDASKATGDAAASIAMLIALK